MIEKHLRSEIQAYANKLDMDMHHLAMRLERFADMIPSSRRSKYILGTAGNLRFGRSDVREFMHKADVEATQS